MHFKGKVGEIRWLSSTLWKYWPRHLGAIATAVLGSLMTLVDPLIFGWVIDNFIRSRSASVLLIGGGLVLTVFTLRLALTAGSSLWGAEICQRLMMDLRVRLLEHFDRLSLDYHEATAVGAKSFILLNSVDDIAALGAEVLPLLARSIIVGCMVPILMIIISPRLGLMLLFSLPVYLFATKHFKLQIRETSDAANCALDQMSQYVHEHLATVPQIQILSNEAGALAKASKLMSDVVKYQRGRVRSEQRYVLVNRAITALCTVVVFGYGGHLVQKGAMSIGSLVVCYSYLTRLFDPISAIASAQTQIQKSLSSIRRLQEFFALSPSVAPPLFPKPIRQPESVLLECSEVSYSYNGGRMAVRNLTCSLQPREHVAIIGRSGAGKSTAAKLIARLYDPQLGTIKINGDDIRLVDLEQVRRRVHYMPQHAVLFTGTVEDNLRYGNPVATARELRRVIELVHLDPVIHRMPRGLQEMLGPNGSQISGGERQRLALGRALLHFPGVLILDEATAFLDVALEREILENLRNCFPETTLVLISHRLPALTWADRHLVLDRGELVAVGTHRSLYGECNQYRELYDLAMKEQPQVEALSRN